MVSNGLERSWVKAGVSWEDGCQEVLLTSQAACSPCLCPNFERNREGFGLAKAVALVSSLHCGRGGGWRSPVYPLHQGCSKRCVTPLPASVTSGCLADRKLRTKHCQLNTIRMY